MNKIDDLSRSVDRIAHDVENIKLKFFVPKVDESIKALYVSVKKRTAILRAKREFLEKAFSSDFFRKSDEDLKMIGVSSIGSLFSKVNNDEKGIGEESTLARRRPIIRRVEILLRKLIKVGLKRSKL